MPQPPAKAEKKNPEEKVEIIPSASETPQQPTAEVEIDLATGHPVSGQPHAEPSVSVEEFRKLQARYEYQARQFEKSQREFNDQLTQLRNRPQPVIHTEKSGDDDLYGLSKEYLNQIGQNDWTQPVKLMAEKIAEKKAEEKFKAMIEERDKQQEALAKQQTEANMIERSKTRVLEKYPSLNDETSEEFRGFYAAYNTMLQEDPNLMKNSYGPELVMNRWESQSNQKSKSPVADLESERLKRIAAGVSPQGRPMAQPKTIKLTQEEVDFCKNKGISPAVYAQMKEANFKEGVTA